MVSMPEQITLRATGAVARRQAMARASRYVLLFATLIGVGALVFLAVDTVRVGWSAIDWGFLTSYPSRRAEDAGLRSSILGSFWVLLTTIVLAIPVAIGTAVFLEEFAPRNKFTMLVRLNISNLAGVPSIIYGILGLTIFVRALGMGPSIIAGSLTLALMILPMTVIASVEAIRQVPPSIPQGSLALGATRLQTIWYHTLPYALPGIMTGTILAIARAAGETAALIMIGAFAFIAFDNRPTTSDPFGVFGQSFTTLPIQVYNWTTRPQEAFRVNAAGGIIVLMVTVVGLNLVAVLIRERFRRR